jgi:hypothetical protein
MENKKMLKLQKFIKQNDNWEELLKAKPFALNIKRDGDYVLFAYNMIESDFSNDIVQECRGLILYAPTWEAVCVPFFKFFNVQEGHAADIDWNTAIVTEKLDGSIIKLWHHKGAWHVSTNGTINAANASLQTPVAIGDVLVENYFDLFMYAAAKYDFLSILENLDKGFTYMFELTSPFNRVVVPYAYTEIYHIGSRNNYTLFEEDLDIGISKPATYNLSTLEECLSAAEVLPFSDEGYVVRDWRYNRVKIKSTAYVAAHHLKNNGAITYNRILDLIRANGQDDFVSVYPEYKNMVDTVLEYVDLFLLATKAAYANIGRENVGSRKELAMLASKTICPSAIFAVVDGKAETIEEWFWNQTNERILKMIGL